MKKTSENRLLIVLGTIIAQLGLGTIYTWSLFNQPLVNKFGFPLSKVAITFSITSFALALSTLVAGKLQDKLGIRKLISIAGLILGIRLILTSRVTSLSMLYITAGVIVGAADGIAYITSLSNLIKWFPEKKGLISGISVGEMLKTKQAYALFVIFFASVASIAFCFGGNITVFPTIVGEFFGMKNQTRNYGIIYQGFGIGALSGSFIAASIGGFKPTFMIIGGLCLVSIILATAIKASKPAKILVMTTNKLVEKAA